MLQNTRAAEGAQRLEEQGRLTKIGDGGRASRGRGRVVRIALIDRKDDLEVRAQADTVSAGEPTLRDRIIVDEGAGPRLAVEQLKLMTIPDDLGVLARDFGSLEGEVVAVTSPNAERRVVDGDRLSFSCRVGELKSG